MNDLTTTDLAAPDAYGVIEDSTLTIQRLLPGPIERVWSYLTESDLRRQWMASGDMELKVGAPFELTWRNDELTDPPGKKPDGFGREHSMKSEITECDPPHRLSFTWGSTGGVTFALEPRGSRVLLTVIHRRLSREVMAMVGPGWHAHLDVLVARISGEQVVGPFWDRWVSLKKEYERRLPA
jgi:uncharacterized protein YndB with AHSA1/START domain